jgi:hypothetical protein
LIQVVFREGEIVGALRSSAYQDDWGRTPVEVWVCPDCGRIYAHEHLLQEEDEPKLVPEYHVICRPCGAPLFDPTASHPTFWLCADKQLLSTAIKEFFTYDTDPTTAGCKSPEPRRVFTSETFPSLDAFRASRFGG